MGPPAGGQASAPSDLVGEELVVSYPTADEPAIECETVVVPGGEITAIVGPNGSGKSTLLRAMADQLTPDSGQVLLEDEPVASMGARELARRVGLLSQEGASADGITVEDLVVHGRYPHRGVFEGLDGADRDAIDRAISLAGIGHLRDRELGTLSGGQTQLARIAMVLAQETDALLLDEPTTYLDLHHQLRVLKVVRSLNADAGVTVGVVLHDVGRAARLADNLVAMRAGEPYDWGPPADVVTEALLADVFEIEATVQRTGTGDPRITAHRPLE